MGQGVGNIVGAVMTGQGDGGQTFELAGMGQGVGQTLEKQSIGQGRNQILGTTVMDQGLLQALGSPVMGKTVGVGVGKPFAVSGIGQGASHTFGGTGRGNRQTLGGALIGSPGRVQQRIIGVHKGVGIRGRIQKLQTQISRLKHRMGGMNKRGRHGNSFNSFRHIDQQNIGQPLRDSASLGIKRKEKGGKRKLNKKLKMPKMRQPTGMTPVDLSSFDSSVNTIQGQPTTIPVGELPAIQPHQVLVDSGAVIPIIPNQGVDLQQTLVEHSVPALTGNAKRKHRNKKSGKQGVGVLMDKNKNKNRKPGKQSASAPVIKIGKHNRNKMPGKQSVRVRKDKHKGNKRPNPGKQRVSAPITKTGNNSKKNKPGNRDRKMLLKNGANLLQGKQPATNAPGDSAVKGKKQHIRLNKGSKILKKNNKQRKRKTEKKKKSPIIRKPKQLKPVDLSFIKPGSKVTTVRPVPITQPLNIQHIPGFGHIDWG